jgi:hypothetical protein
LYFVRYGFIAYRDKKVVGVFCAFSCTASPGGQIICEPTTSYDTAMSLSILQSRLLAYSDKPIPFFISQMILLLDGGDKISSF